MDITLFGCKDTTLHVARALHRRGRPARLVTILPDKGADQQVAGYEDLRDHAGLFRDIYHAERYDLKGAADAQRFGGSDNELGICIGWQRLIPENILKTFRIGVFGMHGSSRDLPFGRGRSPMNWSILEGRQWFFTNLFKYEPGVDDGPIMDTDCFSITSDDTAETMHYKNTLSLIRLLGKNMPAFEAGDFTLKQQAKLPPTYYPKRSWEDGDIDWHDSVHNIERKIRAVAPPFYGAFSHAGDAEVRIYRAGIFYTDLEDHQFRSTAIGQICDVMPNGKFLVRCSGGVLIVHDYDAGSTQLTADLALTSLPNSPKQFPRNAHGYFDMPGD
jgi:UDP-4-amino-4-deoxy-L-arabinose formyltransferase/UDP-glucuronic acid dehydrogenase (UDP-4-keto-hexauronic acid decarboxylating)